MPKLVHFNQLLNAFFYLDSLVISFSMFYSHNARIDFLLAATKMP